MAEDDADVAEYVLFNKRDAKVYQVPPATSATGHRAADWKEAIWRGNVRIVAHGKTMTIRLLDTGSETLFAQCVIPNGEYEQYVERVVDSSRYWVLKIVNGARHAFIGFGFSDRGDAFDFNACLADFKATWVDKEKEAAAMEALPQKDLSLKDGQTLMVNLPGRSGRRREQAASETASGYGRLAPPPSSASVPLQACKATEADDFDDFADFQSAAAAAAETAAPYNVWFNHFVMGADRLGESGSLPAAAEAVPENTPDACSLVPDENAAKDSGEVEERTCQIRGNLTENGHSMGP
ncbi:NECAP1 [Symbiodinium microadriaticum]|nr:NECAP1 [Symbiodinium microadriaticum]